MYQVAASAPGFASYTSDPHHIPETGPEQEGAIYLTAGGNAATIVPAAKKLGKWHGFFRVVRIIFTGLFVIGFGLAIVGLLTDPSIFQLLLIIAYALLSILQIY